MKNITLILCLTFMNVLIYAQGLESIIVEKYYVSDANDTNANSVGGILPVGSVTYRIYVDMLPGYKFQAAYGVPGHELRIATTTLFFNNEDRGATTPVYTKTQARNNTVMLDSWLSVGAACAGNFGILKANDDGVATVINNDGVLQNADPMAGIALTAEDGLIAGSPEIVTPVGITTEIAVFDNQNNGTNGPVFSTFNGAWSSLYGSVGPDTIDNKVLIAQITTDGVLSFELNIQIGTPVPGIIENYVASNPVGNEIQNASLTYSSLVSTGTPLKHSNAAFSVYPNPAGNFVKLEIPGVKHGIDYSYTMYDARGKMILHKEIGIIREKYEERIDLSTLTKGQYIIELITDGVSSSKQIILN